jgi:hypothetical protein
MQTVKFFSDRNNDRLNYMSLEETVNDWLEQNKVTIKQVRYACKAPGDAEGQHHSSLVLLCDEASELCPQRIRIFNTGYSDVSETEKAIALWQEREPVDIKGIDIYARIATDMFGKTNCHILVLYEPRT